MVLHLTLAHFLIFTSTMQVKYQRVSSEYSTKRTTSNDTNFIKERSFSKNTGGRNEKSDPVMYPFMVSLHIKRDHFCTGTLVNYNWVLTSAYCISDELRRKDIAVLAGECQSYGHPLIQTRYPKKFIIHQGYDADGHLGDVGMIWVKPPFHPNGCLSPVTLPQRTSLEVSLFENDAVTAVKWNPEHDQNEQNHSIREETLTAISSSDCQTHYRPMDQPNYMFICTTKSEKSDYSSDSGSPLLRDGVQIGIMTYMEDRSEDSPQIYTRVDSFLHWVEVTAHGHRHINCAVVILLASFLSARMILA